MSPLAALRPPGGDAGSEGRQKLAALPQLLPQPPAPKPAPPWAALVQAQDAARKRYAPTKSPPRRTFCNQSVCYIARANHGGPEAMAPLLGPQGQPLLANGIASNLPHSRAWERVSPAEAQRRANLGTTVIATVPGIGHVDTVRPQGVPGDKVVPNSRRPLLNDIGYDDQIEGGNWAFPKDRFSEIQYYALRAEPIGGGR